MKYSEALDFLYSQLPMFHRIGNAAYKASLSNTLELDEYFGHPHQQFKTIHIAGTNGKGSTSHYLASIFQSAGYKTGLYTSPHLIDFRERIKINGIEIPEKEVIEFIEKYKGIIEKIKPSFFEMTVALAFDYFAKQKVDIAVVEVGLGGRLDSTNIIHPVLSVITNISNDHKDLLGDTLEKIAIEKAGIIKHQVPVVISQTQSGIDQIFKTKASECNSPVYFADRIYQCPFATLTPDGKQQFYIYKQNELLFNDLKTDLLGNYQRKNILGVLTAIDILKNQQFKIPLQAIKDGILKVSRQTGLKGRWQIIQTNPLIVCDTGHNEDGIKNVLIQIKETPHRQLHMVIGFVGDKDIQSILTLLPKQAFYYFTKASIPRALDEKILCEKALLFGLSGKTFPNVHKAVEAAKIGAGQEDLIFIGGSTFVVGDALQH